MSRTLREQLNDVFVNRSGEIHSKDEVQETGQGRGRLRKLRDAERKMEEEMKVLRVKGLQCGAGTKECVRYFSEANSVNSELRDIRKAIRKLNKKLGR